MWRIFGIYVRTQTAVLGLGELAAISTLFVMMVGSLATPDGVDLGPGASVALPILAATTMWLAMIATGVDEPHRHRDITNLVGRLVVACLLGGMPLYFATVTWYPDRERLATAVLWVPLISFAIGLLCRQIGQVRATSRLFQRRVLILGTGLVAEELRSMIEDQRLTDVTLDGHCREAAASNDMTTVPAGRVVTGDDELCAYALRSGVTEIVLALDDRRGHTPTEQLLECKFRGIKVIDVDSFRERETGKISLASIRPSWLIFSDGFRRGPFLASGKRLFDVSISAFLLLLWAPFLALVMIAIKFDSPGPIFYWQSRVGVDGRVFNLVKFRSMRTDAERDGRPQWAATNDSRITRLGQLMRKTRIDEIPQILNVLRGDMSFVGPRPERPFFVEQLAKEIPYYHERHRVKPGITGWSQINYPYGASVADAREKLQYDFYYMKNHSLLMDFMIVLKTVRVVLWAEGAR